ncbi:hypothetical protein [Moheibacter lacus]|uniref:Uncharacterized protein n=1 Tax=Moheibacter lacus TaxID=2745851 RepID=A0A838ZS48_9FLAO|nr:hypothetical protein [Moheibacter lacus]MBA5628899.1 hypothetical protein [Moheibacter lacus]
MQIKFYIFFLFWILGSISIFAQVPAWQNDNLRQDSIVVSDTVQLNARVILPEKLMISDEEGKPISALFYKIDYTTGEIIFDESLVGKKLAISYYIHPDLQSASVFSKDTALIIEPTQENKYYALSEEYKEQKKPFDGLNSRGSLVRGIRFGNNQSASVQSSLDLQLTGNLTEEIGINAVISDNNVPIQADGYTQQLQEFDKVYVELFNKNSKVRAGHIDLIQEKDFFGNFTQKVTGLQVGTELTHGNDSKTRVSVAGSVTRGEFATKKFTGQNGNQGPYRLSGNNNELYIIIVSGSERIYLDGVLLTRGENQDYVINYNTGELTFTSNRLITDNSRITVEYLYANRSYSQFLMYAGVEHESEKFSIAGHFYSNGDSKNNPLNENLSDADKQILADAGNNPDEMFNSTAVPAEYDPDKNLYRKIMVDGVEIFEYSEDPEEELYQVTFTYTGNNNGNYVQSDLEVNGKIFQYVPPLNGIPQGNYEPIRQLVPPKRLQLYTLNSSYKLKKGLIGVDLAMSNEDLNLFSDKDDGENVGFAGRIYGNQNFEFGNWKLQPQGEFSYIQKSFNSIQRLRTVEFTRDFNLQNELSEANQTYLRLGFTTSYQDSLQLKYNLHYLQNEGQYNGIKNDLNLNYQSEKNFAEANFSLLNAENQNILNPDLEADKSQFLRYQALAKRKIWKTVWVGAQYAGENNEIEDHLTATEGNNLSNLSFRWDEIQGMAGIGDTAKIYAQLTYYNRRDDSVRLGVMERLTKSNGLILQSKLISKQDQRLEFTGHYRSVDYVFEDIAQEDYVTGNIRWYRSFFRGGMVVNAFYELGSGVEPQREFEYVKVTDGTGIYKWTDYNGDGIEQLDEFEVAEYQDQANYIRVYTNTVEYVKTNKNNFNFSLRLKPKELLNSENKFLGRWMVQASLLSSNSLLKEGKTLEWNPFVSSDNLLSKSQSLRSSVNFNQGGQYKWSSGYTYSEQESQSYIFTGAESRDSKSHLLNAKYEPWENFFFLAEGENVRTQSKSDVFESRRFIIESWRLKPQISYQIESKFSAALNYTYQNKTNRTGLEKLNQSNLGTEIQWNDGAKSSLLATFNYIKNDFTGNGQSVVGNQMMEGLKPGNNFVWQLMVQRQLNSYLSVNISYDGRKTEENKTIHTGSVQIQARF